MTKLITLIMAIAAYHGISIAEEVAEAQQAGRYQISSSGGALFFLDTATGELWVNTDTKSWKKVSSPVDMEADKPKPKKNVVLELPEGGASMPMKQREIRPIPGSSNTIRIRLGDITGGQVTVEVRDVNGSVLLNPTSLENNGVTKFEAAGKVAYIQVTDMVNNLVGQDNCKVRVTKEKPEVLVFAEETADEGE